MNRQTRLEIAPVQVESGVSRPAAILRVAEDLERHGAKILELFEKVGSPQGEATFAIHYFFGGEECFAEVEAGPWDAAATQRVLLAAAVLRSSERADARMELFGARRVPGKLRFLISRAPAALLQVDLLHAEDSPEALAESFRAAASNRWRVDLDYDPGCLPLTEALLLAVLRDDDLPESPAPVSEPLIRGLGCYAGEVARQNARDHGVPGGWRESGRGECVLDLGGLTLDPVREAGAFLRGGEEGSVSRYVRHALNNFESEV